ncbi:MAG TPA: universal stress protein [Opitutaceae bacterium]|nr:universal stress protein [Opitutaceae bacterium]
MQTILVPVDFSPSTDAVLTAVGCLARLTPSRIILVHAFQSAPILDPYANVVQQAALESEYEARTKLERLSVGLENDNFEATAHLLLGAPGPSIVAEAERQGAHWIVLGSQGHGALRHLLVGSTTQHVIKHATCPVLVIPPHCRTLPEPAASAAASQN